MGHHNYFLWMSLFLVVFTPVSQEFDDRLTTVQPSTSSEQTIAKQVGFEEKFLLKQAKKPKHRGSGRRGQQFLA